MLKWGFAALNLVLYIVMLVLAIVFINTTSVRRLLPPPVAGDFASVFALGQCHIRGCTSLHASARY